MTVSCGEKGTVVRNASRRELARLRAELEEARPYLGLARAIQGEIARVADDTAVGIDALADLMERIPRDERARVAREVFDRLPPERQWEVLEHAYGDDEIRALLEAERAARREQARRAAEVNRVADRVRAEGRLDTCSIPAHGVLTLGLFREADVRAAVVRGHRSTTCARRLVLRAAGEPGVFQVIEDVFNPDGGYFVTAAYDEQTWRTADRLRAHMIVRAGSISAHGDGPMFEPVLYPGGRVDFEVNGERQEGRLHLGFAMLADRDLFVE